MPNPTFTQTTIITLDLDGALQGFPSLLHAGVRLSAHDTTSPVTVGVLVLLEVSVLNSGRELGELVLVLRSHLGQGKDGSSLEIKMLDYGKMTNWWEDYLLVNNGAEPGFALHNSIGNTHLAAESREEDDQLDGVNVVGNEDQRRLLVLDEADNVVETVLGGVWLLRHILLLLALGDGSGLLGQTLLLLSLGLRSILVEELKRLGSGCGLSVMISLLLVVVLTVSVEDVLELGNGRRDLQPHGEDLLLALKADVLRPSDHAREVTLGLDVLADAIVARALFEEGVLRLSEPAVTA